MPKKLNGRELADIKILYNIPVTTRDGVTLYADVYRPDDDKPYPAIVNRTPYLKDGVVPLSGYIHAHIMAACGYNVVIQDVRGTIATGDGAYTALKRGPGAKVVRSGNSILPHNKTGQRIHFYIPSGRLQGHVFVRHNDGIQWTGVRREGTGENEEWKTRKGKKKKNKKVRETGRRTRTGTVSHGVGIGVPQMPMNRAADDIQDQVGQYAMERLIHYQGAILKGIVKR